MDESIRPTCADCGREFADPSVREPCPNCGSERRKIFVSLLGEQPAPHKELVVERHGWRGFLRRIITRTKLSRLGTEAREVLDIDRSDMQKTVKRHRVEELEDGEWRVVHQHEEEYPAKRRPPS